MNHFKQSLVDMNFGKEIRQQSFRYALKYFFFIFLIFSLISMFKIATVLHNESKDLLISVRKDFPDFELKNGRFICHEQMPYIRKDGESIFVIDTENKTDESILADYENGVYITETKLYQKKNSFETRTYELSSLRMFHLTKASILSFLTTLSLPFIILMSLIGIVFLYIGKMFGVLFLTLIALIINGILNTTITYKDLFKICLFAIMIPTLLNEILFLFEIHIPYFFLIYYVLAIFYLVRYCKSYVVDEVTND